MSEGLDLRSKEYWRRLGWGLLVGLLSGIGAFIFIGLMNLGQSLLFPEQTIVAIFSGSWVTVPIMTVAGILVGLLHRFTSARQLDVFSAVDEGSMDPKPVPASLLASLISLTGGFSLGPEVPSGMLAAGLGTWIAQRRKMDPETARTTVLCNGLRIRPCLRDRSGPPCCDCSGQAAGSERGFGLRLHRWPHLPSLVRRDSLGISLGSGLSPTSSGFGRGLPDGGRAGRRRADSTRRGSIDRLQYRQRHWARWRRERGASRIGMALPALLCQN